ncbi:MAG: DUF885 domain-containing protein [Gemmatimonadota bacterium]
MSSTDSVYRSYFDLRWHFNPAAATEAGVTGQNARLGDFDEDSMRAHMAAFRSMDFAIEALEVDDVDAEIDRTALLNEVRSTISRFEVEQPHVKNPAFWLSHLYQALYGLIDRQEAPADQTASDILARLRATPAFLAAAQDTIRDPAPILLDTATAMIDGGEDLITQMARFCQQVPSVEIGEVDAAATEAEAALTRFGLALKSELATSEDIHGFAIGEEQFNHKLHFEYALPGSAPELWRYGMHLVDEIEASLARLANAIDPGVSWRVVADRLRQDSPVPPNAIESYRDEMNRAREFVADRALMALPAAPLEVLETPEFLRPLVPFAAYSPPGPFSSDRSGRFYVTPQPERAGRRSSRSSHEIPGIALHEGNPGHHLHMLTMQALPSLVRQVLWSPLTVEGWALYCEDMMGDEGFYEDPADQFFQQLHLLWRAVRIILDIGLHTRNMSPAAAVLYLIEKVPMDPAEAAAEVRRYCGAPTYQLCYAVGRREILALRDSYRGRAGADFSLREFHDEFLRYGGLPVSLARWGMGLAEDR